jgi:hypothetical protein
VHFAGKALFALQAGVVGAARVAAAAPDAALPLQDGQIIAVSSVRLPADKATAAATRQILEEVAVTASRTRASTTF